jgi:hypothetical protein
MHYGIYSAGRRLAKVLVVHGLHGDTAKVVTHSNGSTDETHVWTPAAIEHKRKLLASPPATA